MARRSSDELRFLEPPRLALFTRMRRRAWIRLTLVCLGVTVLATGIAIIVRPMCGLPTLEEMADGAQMVLLALATLLLVHWWYGRKPGDTAASPPPVPLRVPFETPLHRYEVGSGPLAMLTRWSLGRALTRPRLRVTEDGVRVTCRWAARTIPARSIRGVVPDPRGITLELTNGERARLLTTVLPRYTGPSSHSPELCHALRGVTFAAIRHNERIAAAVEALRPGSASPYRRRARRD